MSLYRLRQPIDNAYDEFSQTKPIWPGPSLCSDERDEIKRGQRVVARLVSTWRSTKLFQSIVGNYVIRQQLFDHLMPVDIAHLLSTAGIDKAIGKNELEKHLHPMKHLFDRAELDVISKRIADGYAIVLWGSDLKKLFEIMRAPSSYQACPFALGPTPFIKSGLRLAITDFRPSSIDFSMKPRLPGFPPYSRFSYEDSFGDLVKERCPTARIRLTHYNPYADWNGDRTSFEFLKYLERNDEGGRVGVYVTPSAMGWSMLLHYVNVHESPVELKTSYGRRYNYAEFFPGDGGTEHRSSLRTSTGWVFEAHTEARGDYTRFVEDVAQLALGSWNISMPGS